MPPLVPDLSGLDDLIRAPVDAAGDAVKKVDDLARKDKVVRLSELVKDRAWSSKRFTIQGRRYHGDDVARAVIMAESGGDKDVDNGICCVGLGQVHRQHAGNLGLDEPKDPAKFTEWLKDPVNNIDAMEVIFKGAGGTFSKDWEVVMNGSYIKYLGKEHDPEITLDKNSVTGDVGDAVSDAAGAVLGPIDDFFSAILSADTWFRILKTGAGVSMVGAGGVVLLFIAARKVGVAPPPAKLAKKLGRPPRSAPTPTT